MSKTKQFLKQNTGLFLMILGLFAFRSSFADQYSVPTGSMEPTILPGDRIFVNKLAFDLQLPFTDLALVRLGEPKRGEVIVFRHPPHPSVHFVKRVVGLPRDHLRITDGAIEINGHAAPIQISPEELRRLLRQGFASFQYEEKLDSGSHIIQRIPGHFRPDAFDFLVPEGHYFLMGDNRDNSSDSREWGFVPRENLEGRALGVIGSIDWSASPIPSIRTERFLLPL